MTANPAVRKIRQRNAKGAVFVDAKALFSSAGSITSWTRRFSHQTRKAAERHAPSNKRPRWDHYGPPLKKTIRANTTARPSEMRVFAAVGSTAAYSTYVDQGTGVYAGRGPYQAKILPPRTEGGTDLWEHTYLSLDEGLPIGTVTVRGQKGQFYFDKALRDAFRAMRVPNAVLPGEPSLSLLRKTPVPEGLINGVVGNTPVDGAFITQLREWRRWRDTAYMKENKVTGEREFVRRDETARAASDAAKTLRKESKRAKIEQSRIERERKAEERRQRAAEAKEAAKSRAKARKQESDDVIITRAQERANIEAFFRSQAGIISFRNLQWKQGRWVAILTVKGPNGRKIERPWSTDARSA